MLIKSKSNRTSMYRPFQSKEQFLEKQSKEILSKLLEDFGPMVVNHMLDAMEGIDSDLLEKLERKLLILFRMNIKLDDSFVLWVSR
jgi:predicted transcriptional regulator